MRHAPTVVLLACTCLIALRIGLATAASSGSAYHHHRAIQPSGFLDLLSDQELSPVGRGLGNSRGEPSEFLEYPSRSGDDNQADFPYQQLDEAPRFRSERATTYVSLASATRGVISCPTITAAPVPTGVLTPKVRSQDSFGNWKYQNPNYTFSVDAMQRREVCNVVSSNGYFHLAVVRLRVSATAEAACLATVSIGGDVAQAVCFREGLADVPSDGCTGAFISVGLRSGSSIALVLTFGNFVRGLVGDATVNTFLTGSFWIDADGRMKVKPTSSMDPVDMVSILHDGLPTLGCFYGTKRYAVYGGILQFAATETCDTNCASSPIAFYLNDATASTANQFRYTYKSSRKDIRASTSSIENGWSVTHSHTTTSSYKTDTIGTGQYNYEMSVSFSNTNGGKAMEESVTENTFETQSVMKLSYMVEPGTMLTLLDRSCHTKCVKQSLGGVSVRIVDSYGTNTTFVTSSGYYALTGSDTAGIGLSLADASSGDYIRLAPPKASKNNSN